MVKKKSRAINLKRNFYIRQISLKFRIFAVFYTNLQNMESYYIGTYDDCIELKKIIKSENGFSHLDRCLISTECSVADFEYSSPYPLLDSIEISKEDFLSLTSIVNILVSAAENKLYPILRSLKKRRL